MGTPSWSVAADDQHVNTRALVIKEFQGRVKEYDALHKRMEGAVPPLIPTSHPEKIEAGKNALAIAIQGARRDARPGDVFGSAAPLLKEWIRDGAMNRTARDVYAAMQEVPRRNPPAVNAEYPERAALATVPPLLLQKLPPLPEGLEYLFMGRDLILYDAKPNLIVDFIHEAVPTVLRRRTRK